MEKCKVLHFGKRNGGIDYFLNGKMLRKSETQRDLGVLVQDSLKVNVQVQPAVWKINSMLAFMSRGQGCTSEAVSGSVQIPFGIL